jgi:sterol desaturase/sphingolipid hydroxylase (fatty acid hydroxylase superfamily)
MAEILAFLTQGMLALQGAAQGMLWPALFFLCLGLLVKRRALITDVLRAVPQSSLNIKLMVFNLLFVVPLIALSGQALVDFVTTNGLQVLQPEDWQVLPMWLVMLIAIFIGDFVAYWRHRLEHSPLLWPSHAVHHSDTEMTWLSLERFHPINRITTFVIDAAALLVLGLPTEAVIANGLVRHYYGYFIHADLPWTYGPLGAVFVSPAMHRWHHAADVKAFNTNYATVFSIFDRAFGTYRVPGPCTAPLGVTDDMAPTLAGQISYAFLPRAYAGLVSRWKSSPNKKPSRAG